MLIITTIKVKKMSTQAELKEIYLANEDICNDAFGGCSACQDEGDSFIIKHNDQNGANNKTRYTRVRADADSVFEESGVQRMVTLLKIVGW